MWVVVAISFPLVLIRSLTHLSLGTNSHRAMRFSSSGSERVKMLNGTNRADA